MKEKEVRRVLPKLFVNGDPRYSNPLYEYQSKKRKLRKIERRRPSIFHYHIRKIVKAVNDFERALRETEFEF